MNYAACLETMSRPLTGSIPVGGLLNIRVLPAPVDEDKTELGNRTTGMEI